MENKTIYIYLFDQIDMKRVQAIMNIVSGIFAKEKPHSLYFIISSPGGSVDAGITLYNFLKSIPCEVIMHNNGSIDSIANVIFMAGNKRYASPNTSFLFHGSKMMYDGPHEYTLASLKETISLMERSHEKMAGILKSSTKLTAARVKKLFNEGKSLNTTEALNYGIINDIRSIELTEESLYICLNLNS